MVTIIVWGFGSLSLAGCSVPQPPIVQNVTSDKSATTSVEMTTCCLASGGRTSCVPCKRSSPVPQVVFTDPTTPFIPPISPIDQADSRTWPTFKFKELGFSVRLPFPDEAVHTEYVKCQNGKALDKDGGDLSDTDFQRSCGGNHDTYYLFRALVDKPWAYTDDNTFLQHVSLDKTFMSGNGGSFFGLWHYLSIGDMYRSGHLYHYSFINDGTEQPNTPLEPFKTISRQGRKISLFDMGAIKSRSIHSSNVAILIEQPSNKKFKAFVFEFWQNFTGTTKDQVEKIAESIQF